MDGLVFLELIVVITIIMTVNAYVTNQLFGTRKVAYTLAYKSARVQVEVNFFGPKYNKNYRLSNITF